MEKQSTFAERLNEALRVKGMTRSDLARLLGVNRSNITRYCNNQYQAKSDIVYLIATKLNVNEAWLMGLNAPMERPKPAPTISLADVKAWIPTASREETAELAVLIAKTLAPEDRIKLLQHLVEGLG